MSSVRCSELEAFSGRDVGTPQKPLQFYARLVGGQSILSYANSQRASPMRSGELLSSTRPEASGSEHAGLSLPICLGCRGTRSNGYLPAEHRESAPKACN